MKKEGSKKSNKKVTTLISSETIKTIKKSYVSTEHNQCCSVTEF